MVFGFMVPFSLKKNSVVPARAQRRARPTGRPRNSGGRGRTGLMHRHQTGGERVTWGVRLARTTRPLLACRLFRPPAATNFNYYDCSERNTFAVFDADQRTWGSGGVSPLFGASQPGAHTPHSPVSEPIQVEQVSHKADAQRHAVRQPVPAGAAAVGFLGHFADAGRTDPI